MSDSSAGIVTGLRAGRSNKRVSFPDKEENYIFSYSKASISVLGPQGLLFRDYLEWIVPRIQRSGHETDDSTCGFMEWGLN